MTQFTSFVAVEERVVTQDGKPVRVEVPVEMPAGVSYDGIFGKAESNAFTYQVSAGLAVYTNSGTLSTSSPAIHGSGGGGSGYGTGSGSAGGIGGGVYRKMAPPPPPPASIPSAMARETDGPPTASDSHPTGERALLESKLQPALLETLDCWKKSASQCKLTQDGALEIEVWLTDNSATVLEQLKALGFVAAQSRPKEKMVFGRLPADKLLELVQLAAVRFVSKVRR